MLILQQREIHLPKILPLPTSLLLLHLHPLRHHLPHPPSHRRRHVLNLKRQINNWSQHRARRALLPSSHTLRLPLLNNGLFHPQSPRLAPHSSPIKVQILRFLHPARRGPDLGPMLLPRVRIAGRVSAHQQRPQGSGIVHRLRGDVSFLSFSSCSPLPIHKLAPCCLRTYLIISKGKALTNPRLLASMVVLAAYCLIAAHPGPVFYTGDAGPGAKEGEQDISTELRSRGGVKGTTTTTETK